MKSRSSLSLAPQTIHRCLIPFPLCFVFVHNSLSASKYLHSNTCRQAGFWGAQKRPCMAMIRKADLSRGNIGCPKVPEQVQVHPPQGVRKPSQKNHTGQDCKDELKSARQWVEAVALERKGFQQRGQEMLGVEARKGTVFGRKCMSFQGEPKGRRRTRRGRRRGEKER